MRKLTPVCLFIALGRLFTGRLGLTKEFRGLSIDLGKRGIFNVFRHIRVCSQSRDLENCVFIVSFKFAKLSHRANKVASIIPMLIIAGHPGFRQKFYAVNPESGFWLGMYEWQSKAHLEAYKRSFVFRMMNKRALDNSIEMKVFLDMDIKDFLKQDESKK